MKKVISICIIGFLFLSSFGAVALNNDIENPDLKNLNLGKTYDQGRDYTHKVLVEIGTGSWCYWCQFTNAVMHDIYTNGDYNFEYVELVDTNPIADQRIDVAHDISDLNELGSSLVRLIGRALRTSNVHLLLLSEFGDFQTLWLFEKIDGELQATNMGGVRFVPLTGDH